MSLLEGGLHGEVIVKKILAPSQTKPCKRELANMDVLNMDANDEKGPALRKPKDVGGHIFEPCMEV